MALQQGETKAPLRSAVVMVRKELHKYRGLFLSKNSIQYIDSVLREQNKIATKRVEPKIQ